MSNVIELIVQVGPSGDDDGDAAFAVARLRTELLQLDIDAASPIPSEEVPERAKALSGVVGALAVKLGPAALKALLAKIRDWATRNNRSIEVSIAGDSIKITGATSAQQQQLLNVWLAKHAPEP